MEYPKISIIGAGSVGATTAYSLILRHVATEIFLIDIDQKRCEGEILDLSDALSFGRASQIKRGTMDDARKSKITVICAGARQKPGQKREELIAINKKIVASIIQDLKPIDPNAIIIIVTNPMDIITYYAQKESGLPTGQVFGTGTFLDTQRIRRLVSHTLGIADQSVHAYALGEHGDSQFVAWSSASVAGRPLMDFPQINKNMLDQFLKTSINKAYEIIACKGATFFGIAACVSAICENIIFDRKYVLPLSTYIKDLNVCLSMPVVLGKHGIERIIDIPLDEDEKTLLKKSGEKLRNIIEETQ
ncbi:L-lactate dehydrogenase [Candidatus Dependentiae bacterium]